jgi:7-cyano-7-deazaguanine synthase
MSELLLLSGGIDSIALAAWRRPSVCLTVDYGQRSAPAEFQAAREVCKALGLQHQTLVAGISELGSGCMAGETNSPHSVHEEFWPFRNQYLITIAAMTAMKTGCDAVLIGTVVTDQRHMDGSVAFFEHMHDVIALQEGAIELKTPAAQMTSEQLVRQSGVEASVLAWSHSCHVGELACGTCPGCRKHTEVMTALGWGR